MRSRGRGWGRPRARRAAVDGVDVLLRHRLERAPERVEGVAVQPAGAALEPRRVDDVRRADRRDVHLEARVLADERARGACVVEVDVREEEVPDVLELEAAAGERRT